MKKKKILACIIVVIATVCLALLIWKKDQIFGNERSIKKTKDYAKVWFLKPGEKVERTTYEMTEDDGLYVYNIDHNLISYRTSLVPLTQAWQNEEIKNKKTAEDVWKEFVQVYSGEIEHLDEYTQEWAEEVTTGWDINMHRSLSEGVYEQILLNTTFDGQIQWFRVYLSRLESVPEELIQATEEQIASFVQQNEPTAVSYEKSVRFERLDDDRILAFCTLVYYYQDDTTYGTTVSFILGKE